MVTLEIPADVKLEYELRFIEEKPIPKSRARAYKAGKFIRFYDDQDKIKKEYRANVLKMIGFKSPLDCPVFLVMTFYMPRPKSHYGSGRNAGILKASAPKFHIVKPDEDNLSKFYKDVFTGLVYVDDARVVGTFPWKQYSQKGGTVIKVYSLT